MTESKNKKKQDGEDSTFTLVSCASASMVMLASPGVAMKLKPGIRPSGLRPLAPAVPVCPESLKPNFTLPNSRKYWMP